MAFPKKLYVMVEKPANDEPFFVTSATVDGLLLDESRNVAVYQLASMGRVKVERHFVAKQ